ncbi:MAG TPA: PepSY-associated TM helix domain-containing protein [Beijerinckiaceae bacterium]
MKPYLLRFHRWLTLIFAAPLAVVIVTGLLLSFPPILQTASIKPGSLTQETVAGYLARYDPDGKARSLRLDSFQNTLSIGGVGPDGQIDIDLATGAEAEEESWLADVLGASRGVHQRLIYDLGWLVTGSTAAMVVIMLLGVFMGLPRFANSVSGWHKATAWTLLPLLVLSPVTALLMAGGVTFSAPAPRSPPVPIADAVRQIAGAHDLSGLEWIRVRGGRQLARVNTGSNQITYVVSREGLKPAPSNWPRTFHEGVFFGIWGGVMNVVLSLGFILLMGTGLWIWARRTFRRRRRTRREAVAASA